jgi:hypothetical protein
MGSLSQQLESVLHFITNKYSEYLQQLDSNVQPKIIINETNIMTKQKFLELNKNTFQIHFIDGTITCDYNIS